MVKNKYEIFALELEKKLKNGEVPEDKIKFYETNIRILRLPGGDNDINKDRIITLMSTDFKKMKFLGDYELLNKYFMACDNLDDEKRISLIKKTLLLRDDSISNEKKEVIANELYLFKIRHSNVAFINYIEKGISDKSFSDEKKISEYIRCLNDIKNSDDLEVVNDAVAFLENNVYGFSRVKK